MGERGIQRIQDILRGYGIYNKKMILWVKGYTTDLSTSLYLLYTRDTRMQECKDTSDKRGYRGDT